MKRRQSIKLCTTYDKVHIIGLEYKKIKRRVIQTSFELTITQKRSQMRFFTLLMLMFSIENIISASIGRKSSTIKEVTYLYIYN